MSSSLEQSVAQYRDAIAAMRAADAKPEPTTVLSALKARDAIHIHLRSTPLASEAIPEVVLMDIITLDEHLQDIGGRIASTTQLVDWRRSLQPSNEAWWWFLEAPPHALDRFDWLWSALTIASLTGATSLVVDISAKFLVGGPGVLGSLAMVSQSVITLITAGGVLTEAGRQAIDQIFHSFGIRRYLWQETKFSLSLLLLLSLLGFRAYLPTLANQLQQHGTADLESGQLSDAKKSLNRAVALDGQNMEAHYNLGRLLAELQDNDAAQDEFQLAVKGGYLPAFNGLATLYIKESKYSQAASLLVNALDQVEKTPETLTLRYQLWTNLGQVRLQQGRLAEADECVQQSLEIYRQLSEASTDQTGQTGSPATEVSPTNNAEIAPLAPSSADAYCLLAEVTEKQQSPTAARPIWQQCLDTITLPYSPKEDEWAGLARERLQPPAPASTPQP